MGSVSITEKLDDFIYKQALNGRTRTVAALGAIAMAAVRMSRWKAGPGSDLTPPCLLSSPLSSAAAAPPILSVYKQI